jgi:hypothetical protein
MIPCFRPGAISISLPAVAALIFAAPGHDNPARCWYTSPVATTFVHFDCGIGLNGSALLRRLAGCFPLQ